jgi:GH18 family chitinase
MSHTSPPSPTPLNKRTHQLPPSFPLGVEAQTIVISLMVSNASNRKSFINSSVKIARLYGFQGLDFNWVSASTGADMTNMGLLFKEWRAAVNSERRNSSQTELILTAAVPYLPDANIDSFPVDSMRDNLNWVHVMAYDYYGPQTSVKLYRCSCSLI